MKWVYIAVGLVVVLYIGQTIEYFITKYSNAENVHVLRAGADP